MRLQPIPLPSTPAVQVSSPKARRSRVKNVRTFLFDAMEVRTLFSQITLSSGPYVPPDYSSSDYSQLSLASVPATTVAIKSDAHGDIFGLAVGTSVTGGMLFELPAGQAQITHLATLDGALTPDRDSLTVDSHDNAYIVLSAAGANGDGVIDEWSSASADLTTVATFNGTNGSQPDALVINAQGDLVGTTYTGGINNDGTVFEISAATRSIQTLHNFDANGGMNPVALASDTAGNIYGSTYDGGAGNYGTIFKISSDLHLWQTIANFSSDANSPGSSLVIDNSGNIVGNYLESSGWSGTYVVSDGAVTSQQAATLNYMPQVNGSLTIAADGHAISIQPPDLYDTVVEDSQAQLMDFGSDGATRNVVAGFNGNVTATLTSDAAGDIYGVVDNAIMEFAYAPHSAVKLEFRSDTSAGEAVVVEDADGKRISGYNSNVTLTIESGPVGGTFMGTSTFQVSDGIAKLFPNSADFNSPQDLGFTVVGTYVLQATDGTLTTAVMDWNNDAARTADSSSLDQLAVNAPVNVTAGVPFTVSAAVQGANGSTALDENGDVVIVVPQVAPAAASSILGWPALTVSNGTISTNGAVLDTAGTYVLQFSTNDGATGNVTIHVVPNDSNPVLTFLGAPLDATAQSPLEAVVAVEDGYGNVLTQDNRKVTLSLTGLPGALRGSTSINAVNGVATFSNLFADTSFAGTLTASSAGLTAITSTNFIIADNASSPVPTITISHMAASYTYGKTITLSAKLTASGSSKTFSGELTLSSQSGQVLGTASVNPSGVATFQLTNVDAGTTNCLMSYSGDTTHGYGNSSSFALNVIPLKTTATVHVITASPAVGANLTLVADIAHNGKTGASPTGQVTFMAGNQTLGSASLDSNASATLTIVPTFAGLYPITAVYAGNTDYLATTSKPLKQNVAKAPSSLQVLDLNLVNFTLDAGVELNVALTSEYSGAAGTISLLNGKNVVASVPLNAVGITHLSANVTKVGANTWTVIYSGDALHAGTSYNFSNVVSRLTTDTTLSMSASSVSAGESLTLTATVATAIVGFPNPTGIVLFRDGTKVLGKAKLSNGTAILRLPKSLRSGSHNISVSYLGDVNDLLSESASQPLVVD